MEPSISARILVTARVNRAAGRFDCYPDLHLGRQPLANLRDPFRVEGDLSTNPQIQAGSQEISTFVEVERTPERPCLSVLFAWDSHTPIGWVGVLEGCWSESDYRRWLPYNPPTLQVYDLGYSISQLGFFVCNQAWQDIENFTASLEARDFTHHTLATKIRKAQVQKLLFYQYAAAGQVQPARDQLTRCVGSTANDALAQHFAAIYWRDAEPSNIKKIAVLQANRSITFLGDP